jgi:LPXTG-site transpeptidase (sortase) family protein
MSNNKPFLSKDEKNFILYFFGVFLLTFVALYSLGLLPSEISDGEGNALDDLRLNAVEMSTSKPDVIKPAPQPIVKEAGEEPVRLIIPNAAVDVLVQNPNTTNVTILDEYLRKGVVRYPESALLGDGNVLLFGHSTNWKVVQNQAYKALNGIDKLKKGDLVYVNSKNSRYTYSVVKVTLVDANKEFVDFTRKDNMLTISTCNTFGQKQDRYVVEAVFEGKTSL